MDKFNSQVGFILLVALVLIGIIVYAYVTVMKQEKSSSSAQETAKPPSRYPFYSSFPEFIGQVLANHPAETTIPLADLTSVQAKVVDSLAASGTQPHAQDLVDTNLVAECPFCRVRLSAKSIRTRFSGKCPTPDCASTSYTLRWMAVSEEQGSIEAYKDF